MRIASLAITNFRCFGAAPETLNLGDLTALVGANGSGKSAALHALVRLFGTAQNERTLTYADFHLPADEDSEDREAATLRIEAVLEFPELAEDADGIDDAPAACFKHMTVAEPGGIPYCRVRLNGTWTRSNLPEGDVEQSLWWVTSPLGTPAAKEQQRPLQGHERSRIHVHYVPASRDPAREIRLVSGSLLHILLRAVEWSDTAKAEMAEASDAIRTAFANEDGVKAIESAMEQCWTELHAAPQHRRVAIRPVARRLEDLIRQVEATFSPGPAGKEDGIDRLSDGQRSLFYVAMVAAIFDVQEAVGRAEAPGLSPEQISPPILNVFAVEEPENHVAPHYLGRIMSLLRRISASSRGQVILSSHSVSILARAEPEEVRHLRTTQATSTTAVRQIVLPDDDSDAHKFVREAVRAYPELYFARFVVLGEGDSEEIVIPRIANALGVPIDATFVSVVPLGGRHVNHMWRLLEQLEIPYVTLLDLDVERHGGGWGRIKYAIEQLLALGRPEKKLLATGEGPLTRKQLADMHKWPVTDVDEMKEWISDLEQYGVFFSRPLDLDFMMLLAFSEAYEAVAQDADGPEIPDDDDEYEKAVKQATIAVLKGTGVNGSTYSDTHKRAFFWYRYLFLGRGKPSTHIMALASIADGALKAHAPKVLVRLVTRMKETLVSEEVERTRE